MALKSTCWLGWIKRLFFSSSKPESDRKPNKWRWFFGGFKVKPKQNPAIVAPNRTTLDEAIEEQRKHVVTVAIATAAAAEAAMAAARAAAEVVRLAGASRPHRQTYKGCPNSAAVRIQSAFRAYLARKALKALKGVVRLQAIARGQAVRRRTITSLSPKGVRSASGSTKFGIRTKRDMITEKKEIKVECESPRNWDCSIYTKPEVEAANWSRKHEGSGRRERMKKYSYSFQERRNPQLPEEWMLGKDYGRRSCRLEQPSETITFSSEYRSGSTKTRSLAEALNTPRSLPRRSFCQTKHQQQQISVAVDESNMPSSPVFPSYMAVTESARAKARSTSTPRLRSGYYYDTWNDRNSLSYNTAGPTLSCSYNSDSGAGPDRRWS